MPKDRLQANFAAEVARAPLHSPLGVWIREHRAELEQMMHGKRRTGTTCHPAVFTLGRIDVVSSDVR